MTPEERARKAVDREYGIHIYDDIAAEIRAAEAEALERAAQVAEKVRGERIFKGGNDRRWKVGSEIAEAIRALKAK